MTIITIQPGDTLYSIAKRYGISVDQLVSANGIDPHRYLVIGDSLIIPSPQEKRSSLLVDGYAYPFIDRAILKKALPYLSYLSIFSYGFEEDGELRDLKGDAPLIRMAKEADVAPLLVLTTVDEGGNFNSNLAAKLLQSDSAQEQLIHDLKEKMEEKGYSGITVDFEYIPKELKEAYPAFIKRLKAAIAPRFVFVSLAPKTSAEQRGLLYEAHDYKALGAAADQALLMTYEWGHTFGPPMAVAPINQVARVVDYALSEIPAEKLFLGLPNYGYDWRLPYDRGYPARSLGNFEAVALARKYGAEIQFDETAKSPYFRYFDQQGRRHEVWYEDARSYQAKLHLLHQKGLSGAFIWNLMRFYQPLYTLLGEQFDIVKFPKNTL